MRAILLGVLCSVGLMLGGCSLNSKISDNHPLLTESSSGAAKVYFIRRQTERRMGISDNALIVDFNDKQVLSLEKGEYVALNLVPRDYKITLKNQTEVGPHWYVKWMSKKYKFNFKADKIYYIEIKSIDGEFRGVFFTAKNMPFYEAKQLAQLQNLRAAGTLAKQSPL
ncbi:hypothetical protein MNBD_GAMMA16-1811 [hydrothermal vent metagenome]|uniref:DUF2846 domain-containing protein n=1 Tax=hydrothermal vent metagenome TaxID=652676 RepID=A0A3B0Z2D1_9ZZZZ